MRVDKLAGEISGLFSSWYLPTSNRGELSSLRRGLECSYVVFKLGITSSFIRLASETTKATRWVALDSMVMRLGASLHSSDRGLGPHRARMRRASPPGTGRPTRP